MMDKVYTSAEAMMAWNRAWPRAHGMTARLPFLDPDLIDLGLRVEGTAGGKDLIREVAANLLPSRVAAAPKVAQQMPVVQWLRGPIAGPAREILASMPQGMAEVFDRGSVLALIDDHSSGKTDAAWRIISLLTLATWFRQNAGSGGAHAPI
jgi:asparagine synthase (glutamine-hydrolysing)